MLAIYYGSKMLEIAQGKASIVIGNLSELVGVLDMVIGEVRTGELDCQIETASRKLRDGFRW